MSEIPTPVPSLKSSMRSIWLRLLLMLLLALAFQFASALLGLLALVQLALALLGAPNARLCAFAQSLGQYLGQIAVFEGFATEALPFPFSEWPTSGHGA